MIRRKDDAVVQRVRASRRRILERCGGNPHRLLKWAGRIESAHRGQLIVFEESKR
jgi:hypothetical protein